MSDMLTQVGNFLNSQNGKTILGVGAAGTGLIQNILANKQAQQKEQFVQNLVQNPAKFASYVQSFQQPLQAGLTADIDRNASAYGAEHGLGSSPAVMQNIEAQALAPVLQQQQQNAQQAALSSLGIYENSPTAKPVDISSILKALMGGPQQQNPFQNMPVPQLPNVGIDLGTYGLLPTVTPPQLPDPTVSGGGGFDPVTMEGG